MTEIESEIRQFIEAWNQPDPDQRTAVVREFFASEARYCNGSEEFLGRERCVAALGQAYDSFVAKGFVFQPYGDPDTHHGAITFAWRMTPAGGGEPAASGRMFGIRDDAGLVAQLYQFVDA